MVKALKNAAFYVGAIIGAGFASGSEIALFFEGQSVIVAAAAGILLGFFASVFVYIGKTMYDNDEKAGSGEQIKSYEKAGSGEQTGSGTENAGSINPWNSKNIAKSAISVKCRGNCGKTIEKYNAKSAISVDGGKNSAENSQRAAECGKAERRSTQNGVKNLFKNPENNSLEVSGINSRKNSIKNSRNSEDCKKGDFFDIFPKRYAAVLRTAFLISSFITLAAMTAGAEKVFGASFGVKYIGIVSLIPAVLLGFLNAEKLKSVFSVLIFAVVCLIAVLFFESGTGAGDSGLNFLKSVSYASMNVFLGGYLIAKKADASKKEIVLTGVFSAVILTALLVMIYNINFGGSGDMPVISAAAAAGYEKAAAVIVFAAIISTMISTAKTLLNFAEKRYGAVVSAVGTVAAAFFVSLAGFKNIVGYAYPAISLFSSLFTVLTLIYFIRNGAANRKRLFVVIKTKRNKNAVNKEFLTAK
ncbi:MAG: hypothetical protein LBP62_04730 [Clostridiales bacterium]|jgi:uncharacterized membrane protein YkvI|nr:hypothetical protein [Clostridiales bacterium]